MAKTFMGVDKSKLNADQANAALGGGPAYASSSSPSPQDLSSTPLINRLISTTGTSTIKVNGSQTIDAAMLIQQLRSNPSARQQFLTRIYNAGYYPSTAYSGKEKPDFNLLDTNADQAIANALSDTMTSGQPLDSVIANKTTNFSSTPTALGGGNTYSIDLSSPDSIKKLADTVEASVLGRKLTAKENDRFVSAIQGLQTKQQGAKNNAAESMSRQMFDIQTGQGAMSAQQIAAAAANAGFTGDALVKATAIALAESGGNPNAHNTNAGTGDNSYSLWQINMLGNLGPGRLKEFGISDANQLFDPQINAAAAFKVSGSGSDFGPWTTYTSGKYKGYLGVAQQAVSTLGQNQSASTLTPDGGGLATSANGISPINNNVYIPPVTTVTTNVDPQATIEAQLRAQHPTEAGAHDLAQTYDTFVGILRGQ